MEHQARSAAWSAFGDELFKTAANKLLEQLDDGKTPKPPTFEQVSKSIGFFKKTWKTRSTLSLAFIGLAVTGIVVANLPDMSHTLAPWMSSVVSAFLGALTWLTRAHKWLGTERERFDKLVQERLSSLAPTAGQMMEQAMAAARETPDDAAETAPHLPLEIRTQAAEIVKMDGEIEDKLAAIEARRQRIGATLRHRGLLDFVKERVQGRYYDDKLGLLHQVKSDLEELSTALLDRDDGDPLFPRGRPRIILLIDDLDRCPPSRVVEVLEAAQLLVRSPLFVVVLAMDVRYITRALEMKYRGVLVRDGEPSGLDYIEKIIQIPYRVRPVSTAAVGGFLRSQMDIQVEEKPPGLDHPGRPQAPRADNKKSPQERRMQEGEEGSMAPASATRTELSILPTTTLRFTPEEHELLRSCCAAVEVSPRSLKRLVNVFKLLKIIWYRQGLEAGPPIEVQRTMLCLLVLAARHPEVMRQVLHHMERRYARSNPQAPRKHKATDRAATSPLEEVVGASLGVFCRSRASDAIYPDDWMAVAALIDDPDFFPSELTFRDLQEVNLHLVSSLSFVGESDPRREAALTRAKDRDASGFPDPGEAAPNEIDANEPDQMH